MVQIVQVEKAMEILNEPCTILDILNQLATMGIVENPHEGGYGRVRGQIARALQNLRSWKVIDRLPQGHTKNGIPIWYLVKNGDPHITPCSICRGRDLVYGRRLRQIMLRSHLRRVRVSPEMDHRMTEDYEGGATW